MFCFNIKTVLYVKLAIQKYEKEIKKYAIQKN